MIGQFHHAGESSRTTHAAPTAIDGCRYFAGLLLGALEGRSKEELLRAFFYPGREQGYWRRQSLSPEIAEIANGSFEQKAPPRSSVPDLWCVHWKRRSGPFIAPTHFVKERCGP